MKIQLKRSSVIENDAAKAPSAAQMEYGEIAVNYNEQDPVLFIKDHTDQIIRIAGAGASGAPVVGDGKITINNADGSENASFTVNQTGPTTVTLPAGFSGDYNDLGNKPGLQEVTDQGNTTTKKVTAGSFETTGSINSGYIKATNSINASRTSAELEAFTAQEEDTKNVIIKAGGDAAFAGRVRLGATGDAEAFLEVKNSPSPGVPSLFLNSSQSVGSTSDIALKANSAIRAEGSIRSVVNDNGYFSWHIGGTDVKAGTNGSTEIVRINASTATFNGKVKAATFRIEELDFLP